LLRFALSDFKGDGPYLAVDGNLRRTLVSVFSSIKSKDFYVKVRSREVQCPGIGKFDKFPGWDERMRDF
jgi:hypothetical protein